MRSLRPRKSLIQSISPWQAKQQEESDSEMQQFCNQALPRIKPQKTLYEKINQQFNQNQVQNSMTKLALRRPNSNVHSNRLPIDRKHIFERLSSNRERQMKSAHKPALSQLKNQVKNQIKNQNKYENKQYTISPLQQIIVRNFIIQGSCQNNKQELIKKKQSSFIMKQKFAQIRRSMNVQLGIWGNVNKVGYQIQSRNQNKQNLILKHLRYQLHH